MSVTFETFILSHFPTSAPILHQLSLVLSLFFFFLLSLVYSNLQIFPSKAAKTVLVFDCSLFCHLESGKKKKKSLHLNHFIKKKNSYDYVKQLF